MEGCKGLQSGRCFALVLFLLMNFTLCIQTQAQVFSLSPEQMRHYTPLNPYDRSPDGRPHVPDVILDSIRALKIDVVEVFDIMRNAGYPNQYEGDWKVVQGEERLVGRAFTIQFMPNRPDVNDVIQSDASGQGIGRLGNQAAIDMLESGDVAVVDLFGKVEGGTFIGDKLAYYIYKTTGTGVVVDGGLFFIEPIEEIGMPAYYRGEHPQSLVNTMITGINSPIRIGKATVMPGDVVIGDRDGVVFVPPHLLPEILETVKMRRKRDVWMKKQFDLKKYKSSEIYGRPRDSVLRKEFEEFMKKE